MANINLGAIAVVCLAGFVVAVLVAAVVCRRLLAAKDESCTRLLLAARVRRAFRRSRIFSSSARRRRAAAASDRTVIGDGDLFLAVQKAFPHRDRPARPSRRRPVQRPFAAGDRPAVGPRGEYGARMAEEANQKLTSSIQFLTTLFRPLADGTGGFGGKGAVLRK